MKRNFKVKSLSLGGKNNKIYESNDVVTSECFSTDVDDLVEKGFLVELDPSKEDSKPTGDEPTGDDFSKKQIVAFLKEMNVEFNQSDKKDVLWNLLINLKIDNESNIIDLLVDFIED
ncbi:MAG: hypothetical protein JKY43_10960 [Phycisphaerales bacterium]|nr:hypothetical protein [Phycisphaerales bacterium]